MLYDTIKNRGAQNLCPIEELSEARVINAQLIADYAYLQKDFANLEEVPNVAPPFPSMWIEWRFPRLNRVGDKIDVSAESERPIIGVWVTAEPFNPLQLFRPGVLPESPAKWSCCANVFTVDAVGPVHLGFVGYYVSPEGKFLASGKNSHTCFAGKNIQMDAVVGRSMTDIMCEMSSVASQAIAFMHVKNARVERENIPPKVHQGREKKVGYKLTVPHVIVLDPLRAVLENLRKAINDGESSARALHFVRGHFKTYTVDKPLLGKHTGTYWWAFHVAGQGGGEPVKNDYQLGKGG